MLDIQIKTIPNDSQRYPTVGDWVWENDKLTIFISDMGNWRYEVLVAVHELVEVVLCKHRNISQESVDSFDQKYEDARLEGDVSEPGDAPDAPYRKEHFFATNVERLLAEQLEIVWDDYDRTVVEL